ncbi:MAG: CopG family transcriptional regulator [Syntrophobacteria bacterium]
MVRTQIYLDERQKKELDRLSAERRVTMSDLIRQAIEQFLGSSQSGLDMALEKSFGIWKDRDDIGKSPAYVREIRREWEKRERRP